VTDDRASVEIALTEFRRVRDGTARAHASVESVAGGVAFILQGITVRLVKGTVKVEAPHYVRAGLRWPVLILPDEVAAAIGDVVMEAWREGA
jgi:hypothetical protein